MASTFKFFPKLPAELRIMVWTFAHQEPLHHAFQVKIAPSASARYENGDLYYKSSDYESCEKYSSHWNLLLACKESWKVGQEVGQNLRPEGIHESDFIWLLFPQSRAIPPRIRQSDVFRHIGFHRRATTIVSDRTYYSITNLATHLVNHFPDITELRITQHSIPLIISNTIRIYHCISK